MKWAGHAASTGKSGTHMVVGKPERGHRSRKKDNIKKTLEK
jgi:hypothetical protein